MGDLVTNCPQTTTVAVRRLTRGTRYHFILYMHFLPSINPRLPPSSPDPIEHGLRKCNIHQQKLSLAAQSFLANIALPLLAYSTTKSGRSEARLAASLGQRLCPLPSRSRAMDRDNATVEKALNRQVPYGPSVCLSSHRQSCMLLPVTARTGSCQEL